MPLQVLQMPRQTVRHSALVANRMCGQTGQGYSTSKPQVGTESAAEPCGKSIINIHLYHLIRSQPKEQ